MSESSKAEDALEAAVEVVEELTDEEVKERHRLELKVERAFVEAGAALRQLRDKRLYRSTHKNFEEYCRDRFNYQRFHSYQLIDAAGVVDNLSANGGQIMPTSERQVRPLTKLKPDEQCEVWKQAVEESGGIPSGRIVKGIVERLKAKHLAPATDSYNIGDVFWIVGLSGSERKYNCCWAIAKSINDFTVVVDVHDGTLTVKPDSLKPIDEPDTRRQLPQLLKRIRRLRDCGLLDRCAYTVLESLGRQTYLSEVEENVLCCLEAYYGVSNAKN